MLNSLVSHTSVTTGQVIKEKTEDVPRVSSPRALQGDANRNTERPPRGLI